MGNLGELSPYAARDAAGFVASMQRLKERAGLTYRELEEKAALNGDVLARSTLADVLRRTTLPRADIVAAFVRACGDGQRVDAWLQARDRLATADPAAPTAPADPAAATTPVGSASAPAASRARADGSPDTEPGPGPGSPAPSGPRPARSRTRVLVAALLAPLLVFAAWVLLAHGTGSSDDSDGSDDADAAAAASTASRAPVDGWVTVRPASAPELCLTDGRDRGGAYPNAVAVQRPCAEVPVPRTYLEPAGEGLYRIQWHHPEMGKGCLTVMESGPVKGMLEPRDDCTQGTLFRLEPVSDDADDGFRMRPAHADDCVGLAGDGSAEGAEAVEERCTGAADQRFLVRAD
ncbi:RICIN domain-containing protein [Streptomyces sp. NPDC003247]|uniref:RICIN domain-containing protein n=1 Tax=Streptomyces sp. NPDC003247 TaxID=3364677 RepID=UPI00367DDDD4